MFSQGFTGPDLLNDHRLAVAYRAVTFYGCPFQGIQLV